ncbi:sulfurtransferase TusA [Buchnera aphidicola (Taiwanaphis decaspermi)]|uniref:sulfurtransferase TusA n=1 Tax=Buchnera aphidicola TaxID=9 RepID=UPI0031B8AB6B
MQKKKNKNKYILNLIGLRCPEPIMMLRKKIREIGSGHILLVFSDDITTTKDIPNFCHFMNHKLLEIDVNKIPYKYIIKKINNFNI